MLTSPQAREVVNAPVIPVYNFKPQKQAIENENTKNSTEWWKSVFKKCATRAISATSENTRDINP